MQIKSKHLLTMLVMAGISAAAIPAQAATFAQGDLLLAFRADTGSNTVLTVDLGQASTFTSTQSNFLNIGSILDTTYTSAWRTGDATLNWAVAGDNNVTVGGNPVKTAYMTVAQNSVTPGTQNSTAWGDPTAIGTTARATLASQIGSAQTTYQGATLSSGVALISNTSTTWDENVINGFGAGSTAEGNFASGAAGTALDLYRILNTTAGASPTGTVGVGAYQGTFSINNSGQVSFTAVTAAPEPTKALLGALGVAGLLMRRRRQAKA